MLKSKTGIVMAGIYLSLVLFAAFYAAYRMNFSPANSEFSGMPLILLTLPWSPMMFSLLDPYVPNSLTMTFSILFFCSLLNMVIIYFVCASAETLLKPKLK